MCTPPPLNESDFVNNVTGKPVCQRFAKCRVAANWKGTVVRECVVTPKDEEYQLLLQASVSGLSVPQSFVVCQFVCLDFVLIPLEVDLVADGDKYTIFYRAIPYDENTLLQCACCTTEICIL